MRGARIVVVAVAVVLAGFVLVLAIGGDSNDPNPLVGEAAPEIAGSTVDGGSYRMSVRRGNWVVVNFFATWCEPCQREHPDLVAFERTQAGEDIDLVSVVFDDEPERVRDFFAENGGGWPVLDDAGGRVALDYGVAKLPETFLVSPNGLVAAHFPGPITQDVLASTLADLRRGQLPAGAEVAP